MTVYAYDLVHKRQTKLADCWYACIQMLRTYRHGTKTKTIGDAAARLRNVPIIGRTLRAADDNSAFFEILRQNGLMRVATRNEFKNFLTDSDDQLVMRALERFGPIMIGGMYGRLLGKKKMGHYIVLSGIDTDRQLYKINDPGESQPDWRSYYRVKKDYWGRTFPPDDGNNAVAAASLDG